MTFMTLLHAIISHGMVHKTLTETITLPITINAKVRLSTQAYSNLKALFQLLNNDFVQHFFW